jgi:hypothetical protein
VTPRLQIKASTRKSEMEVTMKLSLSSAITTTCTHACYLHQPVSNSACFSTIVNLLSSLTFSMFLTRRGVPIVASLGYRQAKALTGSTAIDISAYLMALDVGEDDNCRTPAPAVIRSCTSFMGLSEPRLGAKTRLLRCTDAEGGKLSACLQ